MKNYNFLGVITILIFVIACTGTDVQKISLAGDWQVKLDSTNIGITDNWANTKFEGLTINLPSTLDDAGIGTPNSLEPAINNYVMSNLTRKHQYIGEAWYQKEIEIPSSWASKKVDLSLERVIWESSIYIDGKLVGSKNSLIGSHDFDLSSHLTPGKHLITIVIDNSNKFPNINFAGTKYPDPINQDMAHAYTNHTQIKWNGILGEISLNASEKTRPENLQIYPDAENNKLKITFNQINASNISFTTRITSTDGEVIFNQKIENQKIKENMVSFEIDRPEKLAFWDEFNPALYDVEIATTTGKVMSRFGYKVIAHDNGNLTLNGQRIYLRGNLECAIFPLTGYPPLEKEHWATLIHQAKSYGLNHLRFHSWCPPKAAFEAADEAGFYLQVELPHWSLVVGEDQATTDFLVAEANKIITDYGNHPSFVFMALGNELQGDMKLLNTIAENLKKQDNRHLYATTVFSFQAPTGLYPEPQDEYFVTQWTSKGWLRGQGIFNDKPPHFNADYSANADHIKVPLISHEIGQYSVYPDLSEIPKYTGILEPLNFIAVKKDLEKKGLLILSKDFTYNSGKLATLLYKEEIERALKTPSFDGFQLLQLQDFPGQGTALVGLLNAFWESKGVVSAEEFSQFNSEVVPLIRFEKAVYESEETFEASIEIANFFKEMENQTVEWNITDDSGVSLKNGIINNVNLTIGNNLNLGNIVYPITTDKAKKLSISISLKGTKYKNSWSVWVYPNTVTSNTENIVITSSFETANTALKQGKTVLLNPDYKSLQGIEGRFVPVFWSPVHFPNQPATMGLMIDDKHEAFKSFPTSTHTDWQWWDLCINSKSIVTDSLSVTPIVRVIDNFVTNHNLANVFEAKVGSGKLLFSAIDITTKLNERPVARQLRYSLLDYMKSDAFNPSEILEMEVLEKIKLKDKNNNFSAKDIYNE
jgi:hypothetical protein